MIIEIFYPARCKHCQYCISYFPGKLTRHKCMFGFMDRMGERYNPYVGKQVRLKDDACKNFKL